MRTMHAIAHGGCTDTHVRESALKVDSGRKIPCRTGESNLRQRRAGPTLYQLSYIPSQPVFLILLKGKMARLVFGALEISSVFEHVELSTDQYLLENSHQ